MKGHKTALYLTRHEMHAPRESYWATAPRENWTARCQQEYDERMHASFWARRSIGTTEAALGPSSADLYRMRKGVAGR